MSDKDQKEILISFEASADGRVVCITFSADSKILESELVEALEQILDFDDDDFADGEGLLQ